MSLEYRIGDVFEEDGISVEPDDGLGDQDLIDLDALEDEGLDDDG